MTNARSFLLIVGSALVLTTAVMAKGKQPPDTIKIDTNNSGMKVPAFPHAKHIAMPALKDKCTTCHHTLKEGEDPVACGTCHTQPTDKDPKTGAPGFKDAFHKRCKTCHEQQTDKPDLKKCKTCHGA